MDLVRRRNLLTWGDLRKRVPRDTRSWVGSMRLRGFKLALGNRAGLSSAFDALVAVLVVRSKVFKKLPIGVGHCFT
jgi:hypothetical protein